ANSKGGQTSVLVYLRNTQDAKFGGEAAQVVRRRNVARGMEGIETGASHVDEVRIKRVSVAESALLCIGGLVAVLETAAIRDPTKNSGNKLRIVYVTEPEKHLVLRALDLRSSKARIELLLVEIQVHAGVKRVAMLEQFWRVA